jgi:Fibronectin type III domain
MESISAEKSISISETLMGSIRHGHHSRFGFAFKSILGLAVLSSLAAVGSGVAAAATSPYAPKITFTSGPATISSGGKAYLYWQTTNSTTCKASGGWQGSVSTGGGRWTDALTKTTQFVLTCTGASGSATKSTTVTVTGTPSAAPAPTVTISASPSSVTSGRSSTLTWSSTNATACSAAGAWSGTKAVSGSQGTAALSAGASYQLTCTGAGGSATHTANVSVTNAAPTVSLAASPSTVLTGANTSLTWSSTNATSCTASGGWLGSRATSGSSTTGALKTTTIYALACTGAGGTANKTTTVTVAAAFNGAATLSWAAPTTNTDGTPMTPLSGYTIYYGTSPSALSHSIPASATATSYEITGLAPGTWYFAVAAVAKVGTTSAISNVGSETD